MNYAINLEIIKEYMEKYTLSQREVARRMKISHSYLIRVLDGERDAGMKFVHGMCNLGFTVKDIFKNSKKRLKNNDENIDQCVCDYMNTMIGYEKEYTLEEVRKLKKSVFYEKDDRKNKKIKINGNTVDGRKDINERITAVAKEIFKLNVTVRDITLYKKCREMEANDRMLIQSLDNDEKVS